MTLSTHQRLLTFILSLTILACPSINSGCYCLAERTTRGKIDKRRRRRRRKLSATTTTTTTKTRNNNSSKKCHTASKKSRSSIKNHPHVICLSPGDSIQDALNEASDNTIIYLNPGDYVEDGRLSYGLRISKNNISLIGTTITTTDNGTAAAATRLLHSGDQLVGVYAAPHGCEFEATKCNDTLHSFTIQNVIVENFPKNGIQTRFVRGFTFFNCQSVNNRNNGLYPTLSSHGLIRGCISRGSLDAAIWVAGSHDVDVLDNEVSDSITGIEITVSKDLLIKNNVIENNVVGVGLYHANMAGTTPDFPPYDNWLFERNVICDNNRENDAPEGSFQRALPNGVGVLIVGIRGATVRRNVIEGNDRVGLAMLGFCTVQDGTFGVDCEGENAPVDGDPSANDNTVVNNIFSGNGEGGVEDMEYPGVDLLYIQSEEELLGRENDNCFEGNVSPEGEPATFYASDFSGSDDDDDGIPLPSGGCC